jgi:predicted nucleotidyltransferase
LNLDKVAIEITQDLKDVVFIGAYAAMTHIGPFRGTRDIDLALASPISDEELEKLGYRIFLERGKRTIYTHGGVKVDVYLDDVSGIPVSRIFDTAITKQIGKHKIQVMCLEALLIAKLRAARPQDIDDIQQICRIKGKEIDWNVVESLAEPIEVLNLKTTASVFK